MFSADRCLVQIDVGAVTDAVQALRKDRNFMLAAVGERGEALAFCAVHLAAAVPMEGCGLKTMVD